MISTGANAIAPRSGTFVDNMKLPVHRWFRYSAGFSAQWASSVIKGFDEGITVLDPFAGSGTAVLEGGKAGAKAIGLESHPFIGRIAQAKVLWDIDVKSLYQLGEELSSHARRHLCASPPDESPLLASCYSPEYLTQLHSLVQSWRSADTDEAVSRLAWLAVVSIARSSSYVGTAQWQYVLPKKRKKTVLEPFAAFTAKIIQMASDIKALREFSGRPPGEIRVEDARYCTSVETDSVDLVITSPPYANNFDYADATRLEMTLLGEIRGWSDLQVHVRDHLVRSCTQHVGSAKSVLPDILEQPELDSIRPELARIYNELERERMRHGGKKNYHTMLAHYMYDMSLVWRSLRRVVRPGGQVCFVIGDSAPYGVHAPIDKWFGILAKDAGFESYVFAKQRDRNTKWKNRKHTVPLHEGLLWVQG